MLVALRSRTLDLSCARPAQALPEASCRPSQRASFHLVDNNPQTTRVSCRLAQQQFELSCARQKFPWKFPPVSASLHSGGATPSSQ